MTEILKERLEKLKIAYSEDKGKQDLLNQQVAEKDIEIEQITIQRDNNIMKKEILIQSSEKARSQGTELLTNIATKAVRMTMGENLDVEIENTIKNGTPSSEVVVYVNTADGRKDIRPAEEDGGGLADIVAMSIFMSLRLLAGKNNSAPFFLDEPFKYVGDGNSEDSASFLMEMNEYTQTQTLIVTHERQHLPTKADKAYLLKLEDGTTNVEDVTVYGN